ncbi:hypothetical protein K469DRAFT_562803 [Zopfia rhizophila CBS 207.26]|uniref:Uncharacterized protein n=1 Tax=Zopfia rhizophila CBS 207.26 TaxID=1314779 RepID=A0A6A6EFF1_9PEZI|nr:hypothetical protein K469DRAFT_562803 [Zopfia rhizophila CBS 207.26]
MESWVISWATFLALVGAAYWYYGQTGNRGRQRGRTLQRANNAGTRNDALVQWSDSEAAPKTTAKSPKAKTPRKSVKKAVQEVGDKAEAYLSAASSTAGADADDDLSPAMSPALGAMTAKAPSGKDVTDMLEPKGAAPSVLKLTQPEKPARQTKPQQRPETPQETKKQRQNRKKAEEAKAQREADEKQRQILLEKQRRTAREARGEPAKNGLQPAQAPSSNPWTTVRSSSGGARGTHDMTSAHNGQLLDTFDPEVVSTASSSENATNGTSTTTNSLNNSIHWANLPPEEEQVRMAMEDSEWTTVPKGRKQRKNKTAGDTTGEEGGDSGVPQQEAPFKKTPIPAVENVQPRSRFELLSEQSSDKGHPMDSDWAVA